MKRMPFCLLPFVYLALSVCSVLLRAKAEGKDVMSMQTKDKRGVLGVARGVRFPLYSLFSFLYLKKICYNKNIVIFRSDDIN